MALLLEPAPGVFAENLSAARCAPPALRSPAASDTSPLGAAALARCPVPPAVAARACSPERAVASSRG